MLQFSNLMVLLDDWFLGASYNFLHFRFYKGSLSFIFSQFWHVNNKYSFMSYTIVVIERYYNALIEKKKKKKEVMC